MVCSWSCCRGIQTKQLDCQIRFGLPREIRVGFSWVAGSRSFVAKGLVDWQVPMWKIFDSACSGDTFGSMPSHLLDHFAGFVWLAVENKALAVWQC